MNSITITATNLADWTRYAQFPEMLATKKCCRLNPGLRYQLAGLNPDGLYDLYVKIECDDEFKYTYDKARNFWRQLSKCPKRGDQLVRHHFQSQSGAFWMDKEVEFNQLFISVLDDGKSVVVETRRLYKVSLVVQNADDGSAVEINLPEQRFMTNSTNRPGYEKPPRNFPVGGAISEEPQRKKAKLAEYDLGSVSENQENARNDIAFQGADFQGFVFPPPPVARGAFQDLTNFQPNVTEAYSHQEIVHEDFIYDPSAPLQQPPTYNVNQEVGVAYFNPIADEAYGNPEFVYENFEYAPAAYHHQQENLQPEMENPDVAQFFQGATEEQLEILREFLII